MLIAQSVFIFLTWIFGHGFTNCQSIKTDQAVFMAIARTGWLFIPDGQ
jgi:hypothetical protein